LASFGLILFFMVQAREMINTLLLSWIIVLSASPLLYWLKRKNAPSWLAFAITLLVIVAVFAVLIAFMVLAVNRLAVAIPEYINSLDSALESIQDFLNGLGLENIDLITIGQFFDPGSIVTFAFDFIAGIIEGLSNIVLVLLIITFLLVDAFGIPEKLAREINTGNAYVKRVAEFSGDLRQYVYITTVVGLATGFLDTIFFLVIGVDFAVLWGILAFLLSYIPTIGFWLAAIPPTFLALLEFGPITGLIVFLGIVAINGFAENVVKPKYMGKGLNLSPFIVVFSVIFWSAILGPIGAILSVPMTLIWKELILEADEQNAWLARLMSAGSDDEETTPDEETIYDETADSEEE
jgi:predicted PurR-regulated permease PerM